MPSSPRGRRYGDLAAVATNGSITLVSGLADADTPGMPELMQSRQARLAPLPGEALRHYAEDVELAGGSSTVIVGSKPLYALSVNLENGFSRLKPITRHDFIRVRGVCVFFHE
jgi:hypothetical protein